MGIGKTNTRNESFIYEFELLTLDYEYKTFYAYAMGSIPGPVSALDYIVMALIILLITQKTEIDKAGEHRSVMEGIFGTCLVGSHPSLRDDTSHSSEMKQVLTHCCILLPRPGLVCDTGLCSDYQSHTTLLCSAKSIVSDFILCENLRVEVLPKFCSCKCGKCPILGCTYSFKEEHQLQMIREKLKYDPECKIWTTKYPWICDPCDLPDNYSAALKKY